MCFTHMDVRSPKRTTFYPPCLSTCQQGVIHHVKRLLKKTILLIGRPIWKRLSPKFYARIDKRIDRRLAESDFGWKQHVPAFLNAVSTVRAFGFELAEFKRKSQEDIVRLRDEMRSGMDSEVARARSELWPAIDEVKQSVGEAFDRLEFIRREILFEMRYKQPSKDEQHSPVSTRILTPDKIASLSDRGVRLNLGCGHLPIEGYINVDMRELPGVDVVAEVGSLPFEKQSVNEVFSAHLLEHFPQEELIRRLLPYWYALLVPGGEFHAIAPDGEAMLAGVAAGTYPFEDFREVLFGAQDYEGDFHYNLLTPSSLGELLEGVGFRDVNVRARGRRNGKCFEFELCAVK